MVQTSMLLAQALSKGEPAKAWHHFCHLSGAENTGFFPPVFCEALNMLANLESTVCPLSYITFVQNCERFFGSTLGSSKLKTMRSCSSIPLWHWRWHVATWHLGLKARKTNGGREVFWNSSPIWRKRKQSLPSMVFGVPCPNFFLGGFIGFFGMFFFGHPQFVPPRIWGNIPGFCGAGRVCFSDVTFSISVGDLGFDKWPGTLRSKSCGPTQPA